MANKIVFSLVIEDVNVGVELQKQRDLVKLLNKELKNVKEGTDEYNVLIEALTNSKIKIGELQKAQRDLNKEFRATQVPKDSIAGLRIEYSKLTDQVSRLSKEERESEFGQNLIKRAKSLKNEIDDVEQAMGRFNGNVGNYKEGLLSVADLFTAGLATGGILAGIELVTNALIAGVGAAMDYEVALDDLSAITGVTGEGLKQLQDVEKSLRSIDVEGQKLTNTGTEILGSLKLVGSARPELLEDAKALGEVTKSAIILQKASGEDLNSSVEALTTTLGQFQLEAGDANRVINELAAGSKVGASEIKDTTAAMKEFGTVAKISNVTTGESVALIELLADRQLKGAEAGTQLRNILTKLASVDILPPQAIAQFNKLGIDINVLKDTTLPLETRLRELSKANGDAAALSKIFGLENLQAATIITSGIPKYEALKKGVEGTGEAFKQAAIRSDNASASWENLKNNVNNQLTDSLNGLAGVIQGTGDSLSFVTEKFNIFDFLIQGPLLLGINKFKSDWKSIFGEDSPVEKTAGVFDKNALGLISYGQELDALGNASDSFAKKQLDEAERIKAIGDESEQSAMSISELKRSIKELKAELEKTDVGTAKFKELSAQLKQARADLKSAESSSRITKAKKESDAAIGSIDFLQDQINALQKTLNQTAPDSPLFTNLVNQIEGAKVELDALKKKIQDTLFGNRVRNAQPFIPSADTTSPDQALQQPDFIQMQLDSEKMANEEREKLRQADTEDYQTNLDRQAKATREQKDEIKKLDEQEADQKKARRLDELSTAQKVVGDLFDLQKSSLESRSSAELAAVEKEYALKIKNAQGNADLQAKLEKELAAKRLEIEKDSARKRQQIALKEAIIQGAIAVVKGFISGGFAGAIEAGILAAIQIATIKTQKFARGGALKFGQFGGKPHSQGGTRGRFEDGTDVEVEKDEIFVILNRNASKQLKMLDSLNRQFGGASLLGRSTQRFESGGALDFTPQITVPGASAQPIVVISKATFDEKDIRLIASQIARENAASTRSAISEGLDDNNRTKERQAALQTNREA